MKIAEKFERVMMAAAFAEENEHGTARELLNERRETERASQRPTRAPSPVRRSGPTRRIDLLTAGWGKDDEFSGKQP